MVLRKNRATGIMERLQPDGSWAPADASTVSAEVDTQNVTKSSEVDWAALGDLFETSKTDTDKESEENIDKDAAGSVDAGSAGASDLDVAGVAAGVGAESVVDPPAATAATDRAIKAPARADADGPDGPHGVGSEVLKINGDVDIVGEIPGLVSGDGTRGVVGSRSVLQTLRTRAARNRRGPKSGKSGRDTSDNDAHKEDGGTGGVSDAEVVAPQSAPKNGNSGLPRRAPRTVVVAASNARPRGPAVKDGTQARITQRLLAKPETAAPLVRFVPKPAPDILSDQPKWVRDLFEAHFRGARTLELRRMPIGLAGKNRMKLSRADYAIGWLVLLEAARRDPAILHLKELV